MVFSSLSYLLAFLPITLIGYLVLHRQERAQMGWLVLCSLFFYGFWKAEYLSLLLASVVANFSWGRFLQGRAQGSRWALSLGVTANLAVLGYFKYAGFFAETASWLLGRDFHLTVVLPLAISFFTFQQVAFLVDCSKNVTREVHFVDYLLFVAFFPQLIAGPIVHHRDLIPQLADKKNRVLRADNLTVGITVLAFGLFKKVVIADGLSEVATPIFNAADADESLTTAQAWWGTLCYTFQLYFDFSGYSDMAIGSARLFGLRLPANFNSPYKSLNIADFWRRWHMTLSHFLRDYLYIPLGGNRRGPSRTLVHLMITMLLGGLWHGAGWNFVLWGGLHGLFLILQQVWLRALGAEHSNLKGRVWYRIASWVLSFSAVALAWIFFRAVSFDGAVRVLTALVSGGENKTLASPQMYHAILLVFASGLALFGPNLMQVFEQQQISLEKVTPAPYRGFSISFTESRSFALLTAVVLAASLYKLVYMPNALSEFIYFQF